MQVRYDLQDEGTKAHMQSLLPPRLPKLSSASLFQSKNLWLFWNCKLVCYVFGFNYVLRDDLLTKIFI